MLADDKYPSSLSLLVTICHFLAPFWGKNCQNAENKMQKCAANLREKCRQTSRKAPPYLHLHAMEHLLPCHGTSASMPWRYQFAGTLR